jgi:hypothetical protein
LERNSKMAPMFHLLFSPSPVYASRVEVKKVCLGSLPSEKVLSVCVYKLLNHLRSHCPFPINFDGVYCWILLVLSSVSCTFLGSLSSCENPVQDIMNNPRKTKFLIIDLIFRSYFTVFLFIHAPTIRGIIKILFHHPVPGNSKFQTSSLLFRYMESG